MRNYEAKHSAFEAVSLLHRAAILLNNPETMAEALKDHRLAFNMDKVRYLLRNNTVEITIVGDKL